MGFLDQNVVESKPMIGGSLLAGLAELGISGKVATGAPLAPFTSYRIGGPAEVLVEPACEMDVTRALALARDLGAPVHVLGAGSNVLVPDEGLSGLVLRMGEAMAGLFVEGGVIAARAGVTDRDLCLAAAAAGMTGFEFLEDIPGTVGGGLVQNAEAWGDSISDHLLDVTACTMDGRMRSMTRAELSFGYRDSTFKKAGDLVVLGARFAPPGRDLPAAIHARMDVLREKRHSRYPLDMPSCGSVFKRPAGDYAGRLIEQAGLGGLTVGGARVSRRHHNFIVNTGGATAADIRTLVDQVVSRVQASSGVVLERELVYMGEV